MYVTVLGTIKMFNLGFIPYIAKFSRVFNFANFANFANFQPFAKIFQRQFLTRSVQCARAAN